MIIEMNGWKIKFNKWNGKRVYVTIVNKTTGTNDVGYYDIESKQFVEKKFKGMISWGNANVCPGFEQWLVEQCQA